jgi:hypothetical protein
MRNVFVLPTDKPSRVYKHLGRELKHTVRYFEQKGLLCINQNIYITNDEEIKEVDWVFNFEYDYIVQYDSKKHDDKFWYKKIILTTDQDLIKDGVQPIDDEFLEWFVKNPNCGSVETIYGLFNPMGRQVDPMNLGQNHSQCIWKHKIIIPKEEPKQETLEEAAERLYPTNIIVDYDTNEEIRNIWLAGAKWLAERMGLMEIELRHTKTLLASCEKALEDRDKQAERMYSEEELKLAYLAGYDMAKGISKITSKQFIQSLESKIDEVLSKETEESLTTWLDEKRSKQEQTLKEKLVIELNEYDYTGSSNDIYGMVVKVNGVEMPYHNLDTSTILEEVLEHLGYEVEIIETLDR